MCAVMQMKNRNLFAVAYCCIINMIHYVRSGGELAEPPPYSLQTDSVDPRFSLNGTGNVHTVAYEIEFM